MCLNYLNLRLTLVYLSLKTLHCITIALWKAARLQVNFTQF